MEVPPELEPKLVEALADVLTRKRAGSLNREEVAARGLGALLKFVQGLDPRIQQRAIWLVLEQAVTDRPHSHRVEATGLLASRFLLAIGKDLPANWDSKVPGTDKTFAEVCAAVHATPRKQGAPVDLGAATQRQALATTTNPEYSSISSWSVGKSGSRWAARNLAAQLAGMLTDEQLLTELAQQAALDLGLDIDLTGESRRAELDGVRWSMGADSAALAEPTPQADHFVGRGSFLQRLTDSSHQFTNVHGDPGMGKTTLVEKWIDKQEPSFDGRHLRVNLNGFGAGERLDGASVARALLAYLVDSALIADDEARRYHQLADELAKSRRLLFLDNAADSAQVRDVLRAVGNCRVIITSRSPLGDLGAQVRVEAVSLEPLSAKESKAYLSSAIDPALFVQFQQELDDLIGRVAGLPLALRLVAGRLREDPASINEINLISGEVGEAFDWSYEPLDDAQKALLWTIAAVPQRHVERELLKSIAGQGWDTEFLRALIQRGLVHVRPGGYVTLHDLVRVYAVEKAQQAGIDTDEIALSAVDREQSRLGMLTGALGLVREGDFHFRAIRRFDEVWPGIDDCLAWLRQRPEDGELYTKLIYAAGRFLTLKAEWKTYLRDAIPAYIQASAVEIDTWTWSLRSQLMEARRDALQFVELPILREPARAAAAQIEEVLQLEPGQFHWRRQPGLDAWADLAEFIDDFRPEEEDGRPIDPDHLAYVPSPLVERLAAHTDSVETLSDLVAAWHYWNLEAYYDLVATPTVTHHDPALAEAINWFEQWLDFVAHIGHSDDDARQAVPRVRLLLSTLYGLQGQAGSEKDLEQLRSARDQYLERKEWVSCFMITQRIDELAPDDSRRAAGRDSYARR